MFFDSAGWEMPSDFGGLGKGALPHDQGELA